jgi:hypothetical protein
MDLGDARQVRVAGLRRCNGCGAAGQRRRQPQRGQYFEIEIERHG